MDELQAPDAVRSTGRPRRGNIVTRWLGRLVLRLFGWSVRGQLPDLPKMLVVVAPHTSNWDFVFGMATVFALGIDAHWVGKHTLFRPPWGGMMRWLGGIPVDRTAPQGSVDQLIAEFRQRDRLLLAVTPEGTRRPVERWKTGFYHIALGSGVPIVPAGLDFKNHLVLIMEPFPLSGDLDSDLSRLQQLCSTIEPKHPEKFRLPPQSKG